MIKLDSPSPFSFARWILPLRFSNIWITISWCPKAYKLLHETSHTPAIACKYTSGPWFQAIYKIQWCNLLFFCFWVPFLQEKWQYWQKFWHSILKKFFWQNCEKSKNWFLTLFPVTPTKIKLHKRTVCQMKGNFMYFVTYFMQSTRKTNIMSSRTQNMRLKFIASPFISGWQGQGSTFA